MDPYVAGRKAYEAGKPKTANPYKGTRDEAVWGAGWREGQKLAQREAEYLKERKAG